MSAADLAFCQTYEIAAQDGEQRHDQMLVLHEALITLFPAESEALDAA